MSPREVIAVCSCGVTYTAEGWRALPYVGLQRDEVETLELRNCICGSTRAVVVYRAPETAVRS